MTKAEDEIQRSYEEFIHIPNMAFKLIGYDLFDSPKPLWLKLLMRAYFLAGLASHYYIISYMMLRIIQWETLAGDPVTIMRYAEIFFLTINSEIKIFTFLYYRTRIRELSDKLRFIYPRNKSERRDYNVNLYYWPRLIRYGFYYFAMVVLLVVFGPCLQSACMYLYQRFTVGNEAKFPYLRAYPMQLSYDANSPLNYVLTQILEFTGSHFFMTFNIGTDVWMMCLTCQICIHFAHLGQQLANYSPSRERSTEDCEFLVSVSETLPQAAYTQNWYDGSPMYRKHLLLIMSSTGKPAVLTAKGVINISLDTFKNMMNITYRFSAIIRKVLDD
ncbi:hypothetical protein ACLKA7_014243 [Drosophila subpalustris]